MRLSLPNVLRNRNFRLLLTGRVISLAGDFAFPVALTFAILGRNGSATDLGIVLGAKSAAFALSVLIGGVLADRWPRQAILVASDLVRAGAQGALAVAIFSGGDELWQFVATSIVYGAAQGAFFPAWSGLLPSLVPAEDLKDANALSGLTSSLTEIGGPVLGGFVVVLASPAAMIALDAVTFVFSALVLLLIGSLPSGRSGAKTSILHDALEGWDAFRSRRWVWILTATFAAANALYAMTLVLGPLAAQRWLSGAASWSAILASLGVGSMIGGIIALRWDPDRPLIASLVAMSGVAALPVGAGAHAGTVIICTCAAVSGAGLAVTNIYWYSALQRNVPDGLLSRVSSYDWLGSLIAMPLGFAVAGALGSSAGLGPTLVAVGVVTVLVSGLPLLAGDVRSLRSNVDRGRQADGVERATAGQTGGGSHG